MWKNSPPFGTHKSDYNPSNKSILFDSFKKSPCSYVSRNVVEEAGPSVPATSLQDTVPVQFNRSFLLSFDTDGNGLSFDLIGNYFRKSAKLKKSFNLALLLNLKFFFKSANFIKSFNLKKVLILRSSNLTI